MPTLSEMLSDTPYVGYAYSYPHKMAYRSLDPPILLRDLWAGERRDALFLYLHIPFCEMRCGFCNLFTTANPAATLERQYLDALRRQALRVRDALGDFQIARMAIGGGTPTYLEPDDLNSLFDLTSELFGVHGGVPTSVETSPRTATPERLQVLADRGVDRVSMGVQSFVPAEAAAAGRGQETELVTRALETIRAARIPTLNIDLIYGLPGQTVQTWLHSLEVALRSAPEELYLYPLYVRPLTGLSRVERERQDVRLACYRAGREFLLSSGYMQVSMRMFRAAHAPDASNVGPVYCCQDDGMVGLGCGARSYTREVHYSREYAVGRTSVKGVLQDYLARPDAAFDIADYGVRLTGEEQRRRYVISTILQCEGLDEAAYFDRFGARVWEDLPQLAELEPLGLATRGDGKLALTEFGVERSDTIGPWLYSEAARRQSEEFVLL
ncbi:STM4012 family radical SAM protein [Capsulimonas corticalis]|uniref:STM4012 family radical SAM protein n=1 Tax=Capsulimonas corticalis TaxID=2219043 RepID=UPI000E64E6A9